MKIGCGYCNGACYFSHYSFEIGSGSYSTGFKVISRLAFHPLDLEHQIRVETSLDYRRLKKKSLIAYSWNVLGAEFRFLRAFVPIQHSTAPCLRLMIEVSKGTL